MTWNGECEICTREAVTKVVDWWFCRKHAKVAKRLFLLPPTSRWGRNKPTPPGAVRMTPHNQKESP